MSRRFGEWNIDCKVYVGNLHESTSKAELENVLAKYGPLKNVWIARNPPGFAFVEYEDSRDADDAVRALDGTRINGSRIRVEKSHGRRRGPPRRGGPGGGGGGGGGRERFSDRYYGGRRGPDYGDRHRRSRSTSRTRSPVPRRRYSRSPSKSRSRSLSRSSIPRTPRSPIARSPNGRHAMTPPSRSRSRSYSPN